MAPLNELSSRVGHSSSNLKQASQSLGRPPIPRISRHRESPLKQKSGKKIGNLARKNITNVEKCLINEGAEFFGEIDMFLNFKSISEEEDNADA